MATEPINLADMVSSLPQLRTQYERLGRLIAALEAFSDGQQGEVTAAGMTAPPLKGKSHDVYPGQFTGMSTSEAIKALLEHVGKLNPQGPRDMARALVAGGRASDEQKEYANVASALKRMNKSGEVRQIRRGLWGLGSWYGGSAPSKKAGTRQNGSEADSGAESEPSA